ncbi:hypothetical protein BCV70DRAFT_163957 [Testicularia cyperi]|uniref:EF-hand domain-containing protein n=1 Tax=Testicularia cyperi TaxID=1882483 RepID=A0A317XL66_9BASI|nr:hypothetical protein BCV70DRAFT_163957 [Testicularia cyperi]
MPISSAPSPDRNTVVVDPLYDSDSLQDAAISIPTFSRPTKPSSADQVLPFALHHDETIDTRVILPSLSARNRRKLYDVPAQVPLLHSDECLEEWVASGTICDQLSNVYTRRSELSKIDIVYSWVNGSDWRHSSAKWMHAYRTRGRWQEYVEEDLFPTSATDSSTQARAPKLASREEVIGAHNELSRRDTAIQSRFRDHQELRYAMRSATKYLHGLDTIHIIAPDYSAPYHLQLRNGRSSSDLQARDGSQNSNERSWKRKMWRRTNAFTLDVDRLSDAFKGLPSQLRRVQGLSTDRFVTNDGQIREGQVPQWMSLLPSLLSGRRPHVLYGEAAESVAPTTSKGTGPRVRLHHDWNAFKDNWLVTKPSTAAEIRHCDDYRRLALPTFNSMAIESMIGDEVGLAENFIYANDDFFMMDEASVSDLISPIFGPVFRLDPNLVADGRKSPAPTAGEWSSLWHTDWLLDQRFGSRARPYTLHVHKSFSKSLLWETRMTWASEHARLGPNRFRNTGDNLVTQFLTYYSIMERHREALLWSFFLLRLDEDGDGLVSEVELEGALKQMGLEAEQIQHVVSDRQAGQSTADSSVAVYLPRRSTLGREQVNTRLMKAGWPVPLNTRYSFSSQDGYPLARLSEDVLAPEPRFAHNSYGAWPDFVDEPTPSRLAWREKRFKHRACTLQLERCLLRPLRSGVTSQPSSWEAVFKNFAYAEIDCGDCLIHHLVGKSGVRGLAAFLPPKQREYRPQASSAPKGKPANLNEGIGKVPHLPLSTSWRSESKADGARPGELEASCFSIECVMTNSGFGAGTSLRTFASRLIQRYSYVIGDSPVEFRQLETPGNAERVFENLDRSATQSTATQHLVQMNEKTQEGAAHEPSEAALRASQENINLRRPLFVCINDDILDQFVDDVGAKFARWLSKTWPEKQPWEL